MKYFSVILLMAICLYFNCNAQVFVDNNPVNYYYQKIELANFPEPEIGKQGEAFYSTDPTYFFSYLANKASLALREMQLTLYKYKFKKDRYRYTNYRFTVDTILLSANNPFKTISDSAFISIMADRNKRKWSWRKFRIVLVKIDSGIVYQIRTSSLNYWNTAAANYTKELKFDSVNIEAHHQGLKLSYNFSKAYSSAIWPNYSTILPYNFRDAIFDKHGFTESLDLEHMYIKIAKNVSTILFYCPILIK